MKRRGKLKNDEPTRDIGPYALAHRIATGGMAEVYRALWPQAAGGDRAVVIKRLLPALLDDPEQRAMFQHEADLGLRIDHPNVVAALDHGIDEGAPYLVLEYVFGVDLWRLTRWMSHARISLRVPAAVWVARELLAGLDAVHAVTDANGIPLQVVHRDVSPSNIFLSVHGDVKLGDLGIARASMSEIQRRATKKNARAKGKIGYLPPEEVTGSDVDQRGDIFSAAVVLAEMLMGRPLFAGGTPIGVLLAIRDGDLSAFHAIGGELPPELSDTILRALARDPEDRTTSAELFRKELEPYVAEPEDHLRSELGELVVGALDDEASGTDRTSLAQTIEADADAIEIPTAKAASERPILDSGPVYHVMHAGSEPVPYTMAALIKAVTTNLLSPSDQVRVGRGNPRPLASIPELSQHLPVSTRTPTLRQRIKLAETGELFNIGDRSFAAILLAALIARESGLLLCEQGEVRKEVYLQQGVPCFVTSNLPEELLGETLVANGVIDRGELDMALATMPRFEGRLGETLVALGLVDPVMLVRNIALQVREKLLDLFTWGSGHVSLYRGVDRPERAFPLDLDPWAILEQGMRRRVEAGLEDDRLKRAIANNVLLRTELDVSNYPLSELLVEVWTACEGPRTLAELEGISPDPQRARAAVALLLALGALQWRGGA